MMLTRNANWNRTINPLFRFQDEFDRLLNGTGTKESGWAPALEVVEEKNNYLVRLEVPGLSKEDAKITFEDGVLKIAGERKQEKSTDEHEYHINERYYGRFERSVHFPGPVLADQIAARCKDGVLTVTLPKTEEAKPREIEIKTS